MRAAASWLTIVFSITALVAGFVNGSATVAPAQELAQTKPDMRSPAARPFERTLHGAHSLADADDNERSLDDRDAVVASTPDRSVSIDDDATLSLVLVDAGRSVMLESGFIELGVPLTVAVDPSGDAAKDVADLANGHGKSVFVELDAPTGPDSRAAFSAFVARVVKQEPYAAGIALRYVDGSDALEMGRLTAGVLRTTPYRVLDEPADDPALLRALERAGITAEARDVTIDSRDEPGYVRFMLRQAVWLSRSRGKTIVVMHPYPQTLAAVRELIAHSDRDGVRFAAL